jgi:ParB family chromosome partitioning protein
MTTTTHTTGTLEIVDADSVVIATNIRTQQNADPEMVASITEHGVLQPVRGYRATNGTIHIVAGQRRTLAARTTKTLLPVYVTDQSEYETSVRVMEQLAENEDRENLQQGERVAAYRQLALEGLSVARIAAVIRRPKTVVEAALKVAENEELTQLVNDKPIDLIHAAMLVEFSDTTQFEMLTETAINYPDSFEHACARARGVIEDEIVIAAWAVEQTALGSTVLTSGDADPEGAHSIYRLETIDGEQVDTPPTGAGIYVRPRYVNDDESVMFTTYVGDLEAHGLQVASWVTSGGSNAGPMNDTDKAERRHLIRNNKLIDAATEVRLEFVGNLIAKATMPADVIEFIATAFSLFNYQVTSSNHSLAYGWMGVEQSRGGTSNPIADAVAKNPKRATAAMLAMILARFENGTVRDMWRTPQAHQVAYLERLSAWGYNLATVEKIVIGEAQPADTEGETA